MSGTQSLERGYRRLLASYPAWHQRRHGEEMLGVMLATAAGGKRRPGLREALNIIWAGLVIRLRPRAEADLPAGGWPDALAVFSVVAPVALTCLALAWGVSRLRDDPPKALVGDVIFYGLGLALPFVLLRLRRVAVTVTLLATAALAFACVVIARADVGAETFAFPLFSYAAETVALFCSAGPQRGLQLMSRRAWTLSALAGACGGIAWSAVSLASGWVRASRPPQGVPSLPVTLTALSAAVIVGTTIAAVTATRSALGPRVLIIFAVPLYALAITSATEILRANSAISALLTYLPPLVAAALVLRAARKKRYDTVSY